jgi:WD40 repeat protein
MSDKSLMCIDDRIVFSSTINEIDIRSVLTGKEILPPMKNIHGLIICMATVPGHSNLLLTGHMNGTVNLWDIDAGTHLTENFLVINDNSGVHAWCVLRTDAPVRHIAATAKQLACVYGEKKLITTRLIY